jgi:hypothetical protein
VQFQARYSSPNLNLEGLVTDLSPEGLFFCSDFLDDQGELAQLVVTVPSRAQPLQLRGEVRWVKDVPHAGGMGIKLVDVSLEDRALLSSLSAVPAPAPADGTAAPGSGNA